MGVYYRLFSVIMINEINFEMEKTTIRKECQSSYEFGKASNRHKIYYDDLEDLKKKIGDALQGEAYLRLLSDAAKDKEVEDEHKRA